MPTALHFLFFCSAIALVHAFKEDQQIPLQPFQQPEAGHAPAYPSAPLPWSDLNVLHTTDTHGWLRGHLGHDDPENSFSGDWGDLYSFASHLSTIADSRHSDLLLVDSGDLHDGNGLTDRDPHVRGTIASDIMQHLPYDVMTVGNHELYNYSIAHDFHQRFVPQLADRYLASNVHITLPDGSTVPFAAKYRRFTTHNQRRRVLALGTLFNFTYSAKQIHVQPVAQMVQEQWFKDMLEEAQGETDVVLIAGHMAAYDADWRLLHKVFREHFPDTPILLMAGHAHMRDCFQLDPTSMVMASGRYMETVGWLSVNMTSPGIERRYIDQNRKSYAYHADVHEKHLDTSLGQSISHNLTEWSQALNLSYVFGHSPRSYYLSRYPYTSPQSIFSLLLKDIFPKLIRRPDRHQPQPLMILNSGSARFDISKGAFTADDQSLVFPFINRNLYVPDVPASVAKQILANMNEHGEYFGRTGREMYEDLGHLQHLQQLEDEAQQLQTRKELASRHKSLAGEDDGAKQKLSFGYVTLDQCPGRGDDTRHMPLPVFEPPVFVGTEWDETADTVDLAFFDFIAPMVVDALNRVQDQKRFAMADVELYTDVRSDMMLGQFARQYWN